MTQTTEKAIESHVEVVLPGGARLAGDSGDKSGNQKKDIRQFH